MLTNVNEKALELIDKGCMLDNLLLIATLDDQKAAIDYFLRTVTGVKGLHITSSEVQRSRDPKGELLKLCVTATGLGGKEYNFVIQHVYPDAIPKKASFYNDLTDMEETEGIEESNPDEAEQYVIFIIKKDYFLQNFPLYYLKRTAWSNREYAENTHFIYVNGAYKGETGNAAADLIHDLKRTRAHHMITPLKKRMTYLKKTEGGKEYLEEFLTKYWATNE